MPAGWKPITVQKIIQIQSNLEYCVLTACDWRRWDGEMAIFFPFQKFQLAFLMLNKPAGDYQRLQVPAREKSPDSGRTKTRGKNNFLIR